MYPLQAQTPAKYIIKNMIMKYNMVHKQKWTLRTIKGKLRITTYSTKIMTTHKYSFIFVK